MVFGRNKCEISQEILKAVGGRGVGPLELEHMELIADAIAEVIERNNEEMYEEIKSMIDGAVDRAINK